MSIHRLRLLALVLGAILVALWAIVRPEELYVERVVYEGNQRATAAELRHLSDLRNGVTIWGVDLASVSANVRRHPWVKRVEAERRFPSTVVVRVEEYEPVAMLSWHDALWYVDRDGDVFLQASTDDLDHPVISGLDGELEEMHPNLPRLAIHDALELLAKLDEGALLTRDHVSEIRFHRTHGWKVVASGGRLGRPPAEVLFGLGDHDRQLARLGTLVSRDLVDLTQSVHVDLAPQKVAIVRPVQTGPLAPLVPAVLPGEAATGLAPDAAPVAPPPVLQ